MDVYKYCVDINSPIIDVLDNIESNHVQGAIILENDELKGVITDGDVRRYLLKAKNVSGPVSQAMCKNPVYVYEEDRDKAKEIMRQHNIRILPILNKNRKVIDIAFWDMVLYNYEDIALQQVPIVIMAGGKGKRLLPYTNILSKPLMPVANKTIIERILCSFSKFGAKNYYLTLNYKKELIKAYMQEINTPFNVQFVEETEVLGTAGSLFLLKDVLKESFFVTNCDVLLGVDYGKIYKTHKESQSLLTMIVMEKKYVIPYGVVTTNENGDVESLGEKPEYNVRINTGVYVLEPEVLGYLKLEYCDMTTLIERLLNEKKKVGTYIIDESEWIDIGESTELMQVNI